MKYEIALGFGNNTDYELKWSSKSIENSIKEFKIFNEDITNISNIGTERDIVISLLYFLKQGIGGECTVNSTETLLSFAERFDYQITIGGTCPRAAIAMNILGYKSSMHLVIMNEKIQNLIPKDCKYTCSSKEQNYDIHLIFQYTSNTNIEANDIIISTNRSNRIIIGNNAINSKMNLDETFFTEYANKAKVLLISGFNTMTDQNLLKVRLTALQEKLKVIKSNKIKVYYEDACFISESSNQLCKDMLFEYVDVFSFNEDEMQDYYGKKIDLLNPKMIAEILADFKKIFKVPTLVVHSKYWAIAYGRESSSFNECLKGGISMATTRFRFGDKFKSKDQYNETYNLPLDDFGKIFAIEFNKIVGEKGFCVSSLKVVETDVTTVGLGDSFVGGFLPQLSKLKR